MVSDFLCINSNNKQSKHQSLLLLQYAIQISRWTFYKLQLQHNNAVDASPQWRSVVQAGTFFNLFLRQCQDYEAKRCTAPQLIHCTLDILYLLRLHIHIKKIEHHRRWESYTYSRRMLVKCIAITKEMCLFIICNLIGSLLVCYISSKHTHTTKCCKPT